MAPLMVVVGKIHPIIVTLVAKKVILGGIVPRDRDGYTRLLCHLQGVS